MAPLLSRGWNVLLLLLLLLNVTDGSFSCVSSTGACRMPFALGLDVELDAADADTTPCALEMANELAAPASLCAVLSAVASARRPLAVVLEMLAALPTPLKLSLPTLLVAFCAAVLIEALLDVDDPMAAAGAGYYSMVINQQG
jgi:hypothetical protein